MQDTKEGDDLFSHSLIVTIGSGSLCQRNDVLWPAVVEDGTATAAVR